MCEIAESVVSASGRSARTRGAMLHVSMNERTSLGELALLFLRLGATAFGGPAAHIAMMRDEVVRRRKWLSEERFLDLLGATNLIPGPNSTEMAIHIGWQRRRWAGLVVAGVAFIVPAMLITGACGLGLRALRIGADGRVAALWSEARRARHRRAGDLGTRADGGANDASRVSWPLLAVAAVAFGVNEIAVLFGAGIVAIVAAPRPNLPSWSRRRIRSEHQGDAMQQLAPVVSVAGVASAASAGLVTLPGLFWVFLKIGSVLFGSGYVLLAFLRADLVTRLGWLTEAQLIDAVAVGQVTPGPVFTTATFIGYVLAGPSGALVATAGIFLPAFVFVALSGPLVPRLRASPRAGAFLDGVNVASLALMTVVTVQLGRAALVDLPTVAMALVAAALLVRFKVNATWLVLGGAAAGWVVHAARDGLV